MAYQSHPVQQTPARHYVDVNILRFGYLSNATAVAKLLSTVLEIEEQPRAFVAFNHFGYSNAGCYLEFVRLARVGLGGS